MKLMVIDGNSIINRAFYGVRPLTTREGLHTNAVYGFVTTLQKLLDEEAPEALCVTFDRREPTFRHLSYEGYKAQRKGMPEELAQQLPVLKEVLDAMDIPRYELAGYEADDLIGTISRKCEAAGWACVVVTGDKDSLQLITDKTKVKLVSTRMGQTTTKDMTEEAFREAYGFDPIHIIDLKALMGDASDNIPGVPGVGEKTALDLVRRYQSVEALYAALPGIDAKPGVIKKLQAGEDSARMSYRLATIVTDAPLAFDPEANLRREPKGALRDVLLKLEFTKLMDKLLPAAPAPAETEVFEGTCESEIVADWDRVQALLAIFRRRDHVACLVLPDLRGVCVEWGDGNEGRAAVFLPTRLENYNGFLRAFFAPGIKKVSYEVKDLTRSLLAEGLPAEDIVFDVALAGYLLDATAGRYDLERLAMSWFHAAVPKAGAYLAPEAFTALGESAEALGALMSHTALIDALYGEMGPKLEERQVEALYFDVEHPLCRVLAEMELAGFQVDAGMLRSFGETLTAAIETLEQRI
ncbi:MAG TPA: DNA polymerase I, partial [Candidatus Pelethomonas intestinigallinarum]|nr:DNA polymerase I [Candidatus Pelethomonas intestinigallinarum]